MWFTGSNLKKKEYLLAQVVCQTETGEFWFSKQPLDCYQSNEWKLLVNSQLDGNLGSAIGGKYSLKECSPSRCLTADFKTLLPVLGNVLYVSISQDTLSFCTWLQIVAICFASKNLHHLKGSRQSSCTPVGVSATSRKCSAALQVRVWTAWNPDRGRVRSGSLRKRWHWNGPLRFWCFLWLCPCK